MYIIQMYSQMYLTERFYEQYAKTQPYTKKSGLIKPKIIRKNRKTFIANFTNVCESFNRTFDQLKSYMENELKTSMSLSADNILTITGIYNSHIIENLFVNYAKKYVICQTCKSNNTIIIKENRMQFIDCKHCNAKKPCLIIS